MYNQKRFYWLKSWAMGSSFRKASRVATCPEPENVSNISRPRQHKIGEGSFSNIWFTKGDDVVTKIAKLSEPRSIEFLKAEVAALGRLRHKCIVRLIDYPSAMIIVLERIAGPSCRAYSRKWAVDPFAGWHIMGKLSSALVHLKEREILHRDIKPDNVMLRVTPHSIDPVLIDFGFAVSVCELSSTNCRRGTPGYAAPEVFLDGRPCYASDLFSLGVTCYEVTSRGYLFWNQTEISTLLYMVDVFRQPLEFPEVEVGTFRRVLESTVVLDSCKRISAEVVSAIYRKWTERRIRPTVVGRGRMDMV